MRARAVGLAVLGLAVAVLLLSLFWRSSATRAPAEPVALDLFGSPASAPPQVTWPESSASRAAGSELAEPSAAPPSPEELPALLLEPPEITAFA